MSSQNSGKDEKLNSTLSYLEEGDSWEVDCDPLWAGALYELRREGDGDAMITIFETDKEDTYRVRRWRRDSGRKKVKAEYFSDLDTAVDYMTALTSFYDEEAENISELYDWLYSDTSAENF
jgi:hypothetical protein